MRRHAPLIFLALYFSVGIWVGVLQRDGRASGIAGVLDHAGIGQDWHFFGPISADDARFVARLERKDLAPEEVDLREDFTRRFEIPTWIGQGRISRYFDVFEYDLASMPQESNRAFHYFGLGRRYCKAVPGLTRFILLVGMRVIPPPGAHSREVLLAKTASLDEKRQVYKLDCHDAD